MYSTTYSKKKKEIIMKRYDIKAALPGKGDSTFWKKIGTIFVADDVSLKGADGKPPGFVIDYPAVRGIIVPPKQKDDTPEAPLNDDGKNGSPY